MYLLDHEGVIRYKFDGALAGSALKELDDAAETLVSNVPPKKPAGDEQNSIPAETALELLGQVQDLQGKQFQLKNADELLANRKLVVDLSSIRGPTPC
jgi:hypothetical protein